MVNTLFTAVSIDANQITSKGTALHLACKNQNKEMVKYLLFMNADPGIKNNEGELPYELCPNNSAIQEAIKEFY